MVAPTTPGPGLLQRNDVYTGCPPQEGARCFPIAIDFSAGADFALDFSQVQALGFASWIQTLYVDNLDNDKGVTITMGLSRQRVTFPAGFQGYMPILLPNPPSLDFLSTGSTKKITVFLLNYFMPPAIWSATGTSAGGGGAFGFFNMFETFATALASNSAFTMLAANGNRKEYIISAPTSNSGVVSIGFSAGKENIDLNPGMTWDEVGPNLYQGKVRVKIAKIGDKAFGKEGT